MRFTAKWLLLAGLISMSPSVQAQIYTCTAPDGTRVFSDERCGPDAKIVPGISSKKRSPNAGVSTTKAQRSPKTNQELEQLIQQCNAGNTKACTEWTHGGGPNYLREQERKAGLACEGGSLADCERRYCQDGMTDECKLRVMQAASVSGDTWYLRAQRTLRDGGSAYEIRCALIRSREIKEVTVTCAGPPSPNRCFIAKPESGFARMDQAATHFCSS
jgi:hypothetical protein